ncbi:uncharacterized protein [Fopius arisanus]|uniref:Uncharacterized protein n=1 Tax=Fopius arisanus TaxID=64838 RepID=A0A9R1TF44_9HYME|nr:PREDICTED: uncharacterized protein LOC105269705 [Fopius arisanus]
MSDTETPNIVKQSLEKWGLGSASPAFEELQIGNRGLQMMHREFAVLISWRGAKSNSMHDISYNPTIFPDVYNRKTPNLERIDRWKKQNSRMNEMSPSTSASTTTSADWELDEVETCSIGIQTEPLREDQCFSSNPSFLFCSREPCRLSVDVGNRIQEPHQDKIIAFDEYNVSIQTEIYLHEPQRGKVIIPDKYLRKTKDSRCGPNEPSVRGFHGYVDITTDVMMRQLAAQHITNPNSVCKLTDFHFDKLFGTFEEVIIFKDNWKILWTEIEKERTVSQANKENVSGEKINEFALRCQLLEKVNREQLERILLASWRGPLIIENYRKTKVLADKHRLALVEEIVWACLKISVGGWTHAHFSKIAENICSIFEEEQVETYYTSHQYYRKTVKLENSIPASGKVPDKFKNELNVFRILKGINTKWKRERDNVDASKKQRLEEELTKVKESIEWLQINYAPLDVVAERWKESSPYRRLWLLEQRNPLVDAIFTDWPILKQPIASTLINIDFIDLKLTELTLTEKSWDDFYSAVLENRHLRQKDEIGIDLLNSIAKDSVTADGRVLAQLSLLPRLITLKGTVKRGAEKESDVSRGRSIAEVKERIVVIVRTPAEITEVQVKRIANVGRIIVQPYLIVVAENPVAPTECYVFVKDNLYPVASMVEAIDIAFKFYHVLDGHYPSVKGERPVPTLTTLLSKIRNKLQPAVNELIASPKQI